MGQGVAATPGFLQWAEGGGRGGLGAYQDWLQQNGYATGADFLRAYQANQGAMVGGQLTNPLSGQPYSVPGPGSVSGPSVTAGTVTEPGTLAQISSTRAYTPPQVQVPQLLANPQPQGLGGMPLVRDRMMSNVLTPFASANWGIPQVNPAYLTQTVRLPGGATPADAMMPIGVPMGLGGAGAGQVQIGGLGTMPTPKRQPPGGK